MLKMKKFVALLMVLVLVASVPAIRVHAKGTCLITREDLLGMDRLTLLSTLIDNGLTLPEDFEEHIEIAEGFVFEYTPMIMDGRVDPSIELFNYNQSNELLSNLGTVLSNMGMVQSSGINARSTYTLQHNISIGSWDNAYRYYNCYAYSIGKTSGLQPGTLSGENFSLSMDIGTMADVVLEDLAAEGYWGMKTTTKPTALPDQYFKIIAIRKDTNNVDYHFMRPYNGTLTSWSHKPGGTQPLKWNYTSPAAEIWSNEHVVNGVAYAPTVTYESTIYYILYKHQSDPGVQPWSIDPDIQ